ncbi:MAG: RHS repeat protein, partial [Anaerolineae bacterium]|nr:RHS repeat protein [Anaerolineae bacterium]
MLNSIQVLGKQGAALLPVTTFSYIRSPGCDVGNNCQLRFIDSGQGGKAELLYNDGTNVPDAPFRLISRIITDTVTNSYVQEEYWRANWDDQSGGFGFTMVTHVGDRSTTSDDVQDKHWFHNQAGDFLTTEKGAWGLEKQTETVGVNPARGYTYAWRTFAQPPLPAGATYSDVRWVLTEEEQHVYNQYGTVRSRISKTRYEYSLDHQGGIQAGNLTRRQELDGLDTLLRSTERWYYPCLGCNGGRYIANRVAEEMVLDANNTCKSYQRFFYDSTTLGTGGAIQDSAGRTHTSPPDRGLLTRIEAAKTSCTGGANRSGDLVLVSRSQYEPTWHNLTRSEDGLGRGTNYSYDAVFHVQVATTTNQAGQQTVTDYGSDTFQWAFGLPYKVRDANLQDTFFTYDALGRVRTVNRPLGDASTDEEWQYVNYTDAAHPRYVLHKLKDDVVSPGNGYQVGWTYFDGLGRTLQTQGEREDGVKSVLSSRQYDFFGRLGKETVAYESATGPGVSYQAPNWGAMPQSQYTGYSYDGLGRPTVVTHPDGSQVKTVYDYLNTTVRDELNHQVDQVADAWGRVVRVANYTGDGSVGQPYVLYGWASYEYDLLDRLDKVILPDDMPGNPVRMDPTYNLLGQKTAMSDPDLGAWSYDYDAAGNLTRQTDARNQRTCFYYDALNRLKGKTYSSGASACPSDPGSYTTTYTYDAYDGATQFGRGRRTGMVDGSGSTNWVYDQRGRVTKETKAISGA